MSGCPRPSVRTGRARAGAPGAHRDGSEHRNGGDSLEPPLPVGDAQIPPQEAISTASAVRATGDLRLVAAWDALWTMIVLVVAGAFGGGSRAWVARGLIVVFAVAVVSGIGAYRPTAWLREHQTHVLRQLLVASTITVWGGVILTQALGLPRHVTPLILSWLALPIAWYVGRRLAAAFRRHAAPERILVIGSGGVARHLQAVCARPGSGRVVVGCVDDRREAPDPEAPAMLGGIAALPTLLAGGGIDRVVVAFSARPDHEILDALRNCSWFRGPVDVVPRLFEFVAPREMTYSFDELALLSLPGRSPTSAETILKRAIDVVGSSLLLLVLSPLLLAIALAILIDSGRPVLFRQRRIGVGGRPFWILKFRTLTPAPHAPSDTERIVGSVAAHVEQAKQEAARRATRVGAWLRRTSLDELPQLVNVLVGEMSLVGPRPLSPSEDAALSGWERMRRDMRPGITGLWQVSGRNEISWEQRVNLDYQEVRHWSLSLDLHVLANTVRAVLRRRGAE